MRLKQDHVVNFVAICFGTIGKIINYIQLKVLSSYACASDVPPTVAITIGWHSIQLQPQ